MAHEVLSPRGAGPSSEVSAGCASPVAATMHTNTPWRYMAATSRTGLCAGGDELDEIWICCASANSAPQICP